MGITVLILVVITVIGGERENFSLIGVTMESIVNIPETNITVSIKVAKTVF